MVPVHITIRGNKILGLASFWERRMLDSLRFFLPRLLLSIYLKYHYGFSVCFLWIPFSPLPQSYKRCLHQWIGWAERAF